jgi:sortase (surface protein transpeptidase)
MLNRRTSPLIILGALFALLMSACSSSSMPEPTSEAGQSMEQRNAARTEPTSSAAVTVPATATAGVMGDNSALDATTSATATAPPASPTPLSLPTPRPIEQVAAPVRLRIPAIGVDASIEPVGNDAAGQMGVPSSYSNVAWYEPGVSPGTPGNAVIAGHLDSTTGPAVFYRLDTLQPGDEILVTTGDGRELRFAVTESATYPAAAAPLDDIFGDAITPRLNLITCEGVFDRASRQYDQRLVVYTRMVAGGG